MSNVIRMPDGYGGCIGDRYPMPSKPGSHVVYARGPDLVVEWYDHGEDAPYESANLVIFDRAAQRRLMQLTDDAQNQTPHEFASRLAAKFGSFFEVRAFAEANTVPFTTETDFQP